MLFVFREKALDMSELTWLIITILNAATVNKCLKFMGVQGSLRTCYLRAFN